MLTKIRKLLFLAVAATGLLTTLSAQTPAKTPPDAKTVLNQAMQTAKAQDKNIMVHFEASWCSWCKRLDDAMRSPELGKLFSDNYVLVALTALEHDEKKSLDNPGAEELMKQYGGEKAGLPFYTFLKKDGSPIANSAALPNAQNIGYPATEEEIAAFGGLLEKTAPRMTAEQRKAVTAYLKLHAPK